jgi:glycosyltransferase involved in cell wall biosynthesis
MHILLAHNYYQLPGGEDDLFEATRDQLRNHGHRVTEYVRRNHEIEEYGFVRAATLAARTTWAGDTNRELTRILEDAKPDIAHFGNIFPLISPSAYYACQKAGVPVVQSLDNPRLICPASSFFRKGEICHECEGRLPLPAIRHSCYRGSAAQTSVLVAMLGVHRALHTWTRRVDAYLVATEFYLRKFVKSGFPQNRMHLRPLFVPDPGVRPRGKGDYAVFIGRLSLEKGIRTVLEAWRDLDIPLKIRGTGPLEGEVRDFIAGHPNAETLPRLTNEQTLDLIRGSRFLIWPSPGEYETFGLVVVQGYACGVPVVAAKTGIATEMVSEKRTGIFFNSHDAADLAQKARWAWENPDEMHNMGANGRREYEVRFNPAHAYRLLMAAYNAAGLSRRPLLAVRPSQQIN